MRKTVRYAATEYYSAVQRLCPVTGPSAVPARASVPVAVHNSWYSRIPLAAASLMISLWPANNNVTAAISTSFKRIRLHSKFKGFWPLIAFILCRFLLSKISCSLADELLPNFGILPSCETSYAMAAGDTFASNTVTIPDIERLIGAVIARIEVLEMENSRRQGLDVHLDPKTPSERSLPASAFIFTRRNFALHASGATAIPTLTSPTYLLPATTWIGLALEWVRGYDPSSINVNFPTAALDSGVQLGRCWAFSGSSGHLGIQLSERIQITHVMVDSIPSHLVSPTEAQRAPQSIKVWGLVDSKIAKTFLELSDVELCTDECFSPPLVNPRTHHARHFVQLAAFTYTANIHNHAQLFLVSEHILQLGIAVDVVVLQVLSNWGSNSTCLYHIGVYGDAGAP
jgi:hypothetical protein